MISTVKLIRRPVFSTVLSLIIFLLGVVAFTRLSVRQYPKMDQPTVSIHTELLGAGAEIVESQITKALENSLSGISGVDSIFSTSSVGVSDINVRFKLNRDIDAATNDVRDRVGRVRDKFPQGVSESLVKKSEADSRSLITLAVYSQHYSLDEIYRFMTQNIEIGSQVEALSGVSYAEVTGGGEYEMYLKIDPVRMALHKIVPEDIVAALRKQNVEKPSGQIHTGDREIVLTTKQALVTEEDYNNMIIVDRGNNYLVRFSDVGTAKLGSNEAGHRHRFKKNPAVLIFVHRQSTANPIAIAQEVEKLLIDVRKLLPESIIIEKAHDETVFIQHSIHEVYRTMIEAVILVILVVFLFLGSFRAALVPIVTIPISLVGSFFLMYLFDFTINTLTLLALVMAIGLVVDDAIVVLENIYRYIEKGMTPIKAAAAGIQEISYPVIAMTLTLVAVYAPIALSQGVTGKMFTEFAVTLAVAVLISGFVALTLSPMMCSRLLQAQPAPSSVGSDGRTFSQRVEQVLKMLETLYGRSLKYVLEWRVVVLSVVVLLACAAWFLFRNMPLELVPMEDMGYFRIRGYGPHDMTLDYGDRYAQTMESMLEEMPEVKKILSTIKSPGETWILATLKPWGERHKTVFNISENLKSPLSGITGVRAEVSLPRSAITSSAKDDSSIEIALLGSKSFKELVHKATEVSSVLRDKVQGISRDIRYSNISNSQEFQLTVNREKAAALGIDVVSIADSLNYVLGNKAASYFKKDNKKYRIRLDTEDKNKRTVEDLGNFFMRGSTIKDGRRQELMVSLNDLVSIQQHQAPLSIAHIKGLRSVMVYANLEKGASMGDVIQQIEKAVLPLMKDGYQLEFMGESKSYKEEQSNVWFVYILAILFIFLVLAAQYESYIDPLTILSSLPLSIIGGLFMLKIAGGTLNLYSQIGIVTLIGLISKHGILIVDFANQHRLKKRSAALDAVYAASLTRLRPILMTTLAMVIGALPLAFSHGAGAETRSQIGWVVVGGMFFGTLFTLYIVPIIYTYLSREKTEIAV